MRRKKKISYGEKIPVSLTLQERDLMLYHVFVDLEFENAMRISAIKAGKITPKYSLDDIDIMLGSIAAEANHTNNKKLKKEPDALFYKMHMLMDSYEETED